MRVPLAEPGAEIRMPGSARGTPVNRCSNLNSHRTRELMKAALALPILTVSFIIANTALGQVVLPYDNQISSVNNGRVNDPDYPVFLMHADSFSLSADALINQVSWLGAYKDGNLLPDGDDDFTIRFYDLQAGTPAVTPFASIAVGAAERHIMLQTLPYGNQVFSYSARVPDMQLVAGTYLMAIMNDPVDKDLWLWANADASPGHSYTMLFEGTPWREFSGGGVAEFAFSIGYVPEPSGVALLLLGGLVFRAFHLRSLS